MKLYHGSKKIVSMPSCDQNNEHSDFGRGFYAAESEELAREWAASDENGGFLNIYELDTDGLCTADLSSHEYDIRSWLAVILSRRLICPSGSKAREKLLRIIRDHLPDLKDADIIKGWRADNINFSLVLDFIEDRITLEQLVSGLQKDIPGDEVLIRTQKAISRLEFIRAETVESIYYTRRMMKSSPALTHIRSCDILGELTEYITRYTPEFSVDRFLQMFIISGYAVRFEKGDPCLTEGMSGIELHHRVMEECGLSRPDWPLPDLMDISTPAYRTGRLLALYQRVRGLSFTDITAHMPFSRLMSVCEAQGDMQEEKIYALLDRKIAERQPCSCRLQDRRRRLGLSQKELAAISGVNLRTLQQYETGAKDINKASAAKVAALSKALFCRGLQILEPFT